MWVVRRNMEPPPMTQGARRVGAYVPGSGQTPRLDADAASKALPGRRRLAIGPMRSTRGPTVLLRGERFEASTLATCLATEEGSAPESSSLSMTSNALVRSAALGRTCI